MFSKLVSCIASVTIAAGMTAAAPAMAAVPASSVPPQACVAQGFLNDGSGNGSALSITPGIDPFPAEQFTQQNDSDAWEMCLHGDHTLQPESAAGWCAAGGGSTVKLRRCDTTQGDQQWFVDDQGGGSFFLENNFGGGFLCAEGGVGSDDAVLAPVQSGGCNSFYHQTWKFIAG